jgi:hypothetical protein
VHGERRRRRARSRKLPPPPHTHTKLSLGVHNAKVMLNRQVATLFFCSCKRCLMTIGAMFMTF